MDFDSPSAQEFADVMQAEQLVDLQKLKDLARRGVPFEVRGDVWMYLLGVLAADTSNEESLIRERLAEYGSLNKSNKKLEQTIRHECSRYYSRRLIAKMKPGKPKRPAVRTTEQPDREQAAAAELKRFTDKTESILCAYLNSKHVALSAQHHKGTEPQLGAGTHQNLSWDAQSTSIPTRPSSRAFSVNSAPGAGGPSTTAAAHSSAAGSRTSSAAGMASDHHLSSTITTAATSSSSEEGHYSRAAGVQQQVNASGSKGGLPLDRYGSHGSAFIDFGETRQRAPHVTTMSEPSDSSEDGPHHHPTSRPPDLTIARPDEQCYEMHDPDEREFSSLGTTPASTTGGASFAPPSSSSSSFASATSSFAAANVVSPPDLSSLPDAFQPTTTNSNPHVLVFPDVQPDFHPALVGLCAPFVECIRNETGMYFSFARLMGMLEDYNRVYPLTERVSTFLTLLRVTLPELHAYFEEEEVDIVGFATRWLQDLLSAEMRIDDVMRLWDVYFAQPEPLELHLYVCVAILMVLKDQLEELDHSECKSMLNALPDLDVELIVNEAINIRLSQQQSVDDDDD
ncbi:hypothetical protein V8E36_006993 [Tilletia maclaganii]